MNRRGIALLLALSLVLSGTCLADEDGSTYVTSANGAAKSTPSETSTQSDTQTEAQPTPPDASEFKESEASTQVSENATEVQSGGDALPTAGEDLGDDQDSNSDASPEEPPKPESTPNSDSTPEPDSTPDPNTTAEPDSTPDPNTTAEPDSTPDSASTPAPSDDMVITVDGATRLEDGTWQIPYATPEDAIRFNWTAIEGASGYTWEIINSDGNVVASGTQSEAVLELAAKDYLTGRYTLNVRATLLEDTQAQEASYSFELQQAERPGGDQQGERPSGGFGGFGGGRSSSGSSASGEAGQAEQGFHVTPGVALTSDHASGSKDMTAYGAVRLSVDESLQTQLTLDGMELGVSRSDDGSFTVELTDGALILSAEDGAEWSINALALEVLARSGVNELTLCSDETKLSLPTDLTLSGPIYAAYRAQGYVSKDFELRVSAEDIAVYIDGERCSLSNDGTLVRQ